MKNPSVTKLIHRLTPHRGLLILALLSAVVSISLTLLIPVLVGQAIDNIVAKGEVYFEAVVRIILYIAAAI
ncbi:MAG: ABC transporter ATP-binding protein, partial [Ruminococcus sp.]